MICLNSIAHLEVWQEAVVSLVIVVNHGKGAAHHRHRNCQGDGNLWEFHTRHHCFDTYKKEIILMKCLRYQYNDSSPVPSFILIKLLSAIVLSRQTVFIHLLFSPNCWVTPVSTLGPVREVVVWVNMQSFE